MHEMHRERDVGDVFGVLRVPQRNIEARVYDDTSPLSLEKGVAWVASNSAPGEPGNVVIAGHRDSYFRNLEGLPVGSSLELVLDGDTRRYQVSSIEIVDALDVSPLDQTEVDILTLVTCYPFYYKGYAPDRYIIRADRIE